MDEIVSKDVFNCKGEVKLTDTNDDRIHITCACCSLNYFVKKSF